MFMASLLFPLMPLIEKLVLIYSQHTHEMMIFLLTQPPPNFPRTHTHNATQDLRHQSLISPLERTTPLSQTSTIPAPAPMASSQSVFKMVKLAGPSPSHLLFKYGDGMCYSWLTCCVCMCACVCVFVVKIIWMLTLEILWNCTSRTVAVVVADQV